MIFVLTAFSSNIQASTDFDTICEFAGEYMSLVESKVYADAFKTTLKSAIERDLKTCYVEAQGFRLNVEIFRA